MLNLIKGAWASASDIVRMTIVICVAIAVIVGLVYGVDVLPLLLGAN